ncbi:MAG: hypothetical protein JJU12_05315 [Chlamydiales bacterium]|nr:hypothetical protein [Chlamydiales bacterium]
MTRSASDTCQCFGRAVAYTVYNLGVGILVGFARTIVATYFLAKQYFYQAAYELASNEESSSSNPVTEFFKNLKKVATDATVKSFQGAKIEKWKGQLARGLIEMVPLLGTGYFTYRDNQTRGGWHRDTYKASTYGIKELGKIIGDEYQSDLAVKQLLGPDTYNPIDLRFQEFIRS